VYFKSPNPIRGFRNW